MEKSKKKIILIVILIIAIITGGVCYYNKIKSSSVNNTEGVKNETTEKIDDDGDIEEVANYDTKNIQFLNNNDVVSLQLGIFNGDYIQTKETKNKRKIQAVVNYLKNLRIEETDYNGVSNTADDGFSFSDKDGKRYNIDCYGNIIAVEINGEFTGKFYRLPDYNREELLKICAEAGFRDEAGNKISY